MLEVDLGVGPGFEAERRGSLAGAHSKQRVGRKDVPAQRRPACDPIELSELLEGVDARVRVRPDADGDAALENALDREVPVAEVRLGRGAGADARTVLSKEVELRVVRVCRVDDRRPRAQAAVFG